jgi:4-amino-4-deoxy-L-arabinose transferase-like glycosyltransferase
MGALARVYRAATKGTAETIGWREPAIFWTALAAGVLLKGPLILMIVGLPMIALTAIDRSARWIAILRPLPGLAWFLVLVLPWFAAIASRSGGGFFVASIGQDLLGKVARGQESHGAPPGFYFVLFWVTFWPGAMLAGLAARAVWSVRHEHAARFLLAWILPSWIVFEIVPTKLPHYVLPLYPAVAILIAGAVEFRVLARNRWLVRGTIWWFIVPLVAGIVLVAIAAAVGRQLGFLAWPFLAVAVVFGLLAWRLYDADGAERSLLRATVASILLAIGAYAVIFPSLGTVFPSVTLASIMRTADCERPMAASVGFYEPSLVFLAGTETRLTDSSGAADFLLVGGCRFAFVDSRHERTFAQRAEAIGLRYARGPRIEAFNINGGRHLTIAVYRSDVRP